MSKILCVHKMCLRRAYNVPIELNSFSKIDKVRISRMHEKNILGYVIMRSIFYNNMTVFIRSGQHPMKWSFFKPVILSSYNFSTVMFSCEVLLYIFKH